MKAFVFAAAAAGALLAAGAAQAQNTNTARAAGLMDTLRGEILRREHLAPAGEGRTVYHAELGSLGAGTDRTVHLISGWSGTITVAGFCDAYCNDLDLYVTDDYGNEVATDVSINATPVVTFYADAARTYSLRTRMYGCQEDVICMYAVGAFSR